MIRVQGVSKTYGTVRALEQTDVFVEEKSFTAILGPSGSGKTTLLRMVAGLETSDSGTIELDGRVVFSAESRLELPAERRGVGMVFQDFALWPHMSVFENVAFGLRARRIRSGVNDRVKRAIEMVRLEGKERRFPHELSGGEQQRVAFARAIVTEPRIVLLDEPLSALDALLREQMRYELKALVTRLGLTALYVTHDQTEAMSMADQLIVMDHGRVLQTGRPEEVYAHPTHEFVARFLGRSNWFADHTRMVRPEQLRWDCPDGPHDPVDGVVVQTGYLGDRYEIVFELDANGNGAAGKTVWIAYSHSHKEVGERVRLFLIPDDVNHITFLGAENGKTKVTVKA